MKKISFGNKTKNGKKGGRKGKKLLLILILLLVVILGVYAAVRMKAEKAASANVKEVMTATVETRISPRSCRHRVRSLRRIHTISPLSWRAR